MYMVDRVGVFIIRQAYILPIKNLDGFFVINVVPGNLLLWSLIFISGVEGNTWAYNLLAPCRCEQLVPENIIATTRTFQHPHLINLAVRGQHEPPAHSDVLVVLGVGDVKVGSVMPPPCVWAHLLKIQEVMNYKRVYG